jgi:hypothetical protein
MSSSEGTSLPGVEVADIRDLKRWTTYFTPGEETHGIWWRTHRELPSGTVFQLTVNDDRGDVAWRGSVEVAVDSAVDSDDRGLPLVPSGDWQALRERLPGLTYVATEQLKLPPHIRRKPPT